MQLIQNTNTGQFAIVGVTAHYLETLQERGEVLWRDCEKVGQHSSTGHWMASNEAFTLVIDFCNSDSRVVKFA